jgi:hypothetical protein
MNVSALQAVGTEAWEAAATMEAARVTVVLDANNFTQEGAAARDSATILVKDAEDWATLAEREARERVSRVEAESATVLASAHEEALSCALPMSVLHG